jgi:hypothetical protein
VDSVPGDSATAGQSIEVGFRLLCTGGNWTGALVARLVRQSSQQEVGGANVERLIEMADGESQEFRVSTELSRPASDTLDLQVWLDGLPAGRTSLRLY